MRSIPCGHQQLDFTCQTCLAAIADPAGLGRAWGVIPDEPTQSNETLKRRRSLKICAELEQTPAGPFCYRYGIDATPEVCETCPDFVQNLLFDLPDPISTAKHPEPRHTRIEGWAHHPQTRQEHLEALAKIIALPRDNPPARHGRGIITVGGGKYWPGIVIGIRLLRETGCDYPVEIWHGPNEEINTFDLAGLGKIRTFEINPESPDIRTVHGWTNKLYALTHTSLKEVLYLDADAYCVEHPSPLFDQLRQAPFVFWEDMLFHDADIKWEKVWPAGPQGVPIVQGGQILMDIQRAWPLLRVVHWICQHSDFYFAHMYGDQDAWRVGLSAMNWAVPFLSLKEAPWSSPAFLCSLPGGHVSIVHRCRGKLFVNDCPKEAQVLRWLADFQERGF